MENLQEECQVSSPSFMESVRAVWLTMKAIYPFQLAAFVPPLITAAILPMIFALDYSDVSAVGEGGGLFGGETLQAQEEESAAAEAAAAAVWQWSHRFLLAAFSPHNQPPSSS
jgi:hypothetical protein